jgi:hypothetical protein
MKRAAETEDLRAEQVCHAVRDRHDPETMHCVGCRLYWCRSEEPPPKCRAREDARGHNYDKITFTSPP